MKLIIKSTTSGEEILVESNWNGHLPRAGDVLELHPGNTLRFKVDEVDWIFDECPPDQKKEVPLQCAVVMVTEENEAEAKTDHGDWRGRSDRICECGHPEDLHSAIRCTGMAGNCPCQGFKLKTT
jgi:hypothetical protein